ncbi:nucleoside-diphosphate sugar epimerase [candidate division MSBL1 archaeon SCGC-AAA382C18]|uniref:Nucleoside-diphosphate sugar epimerase n=1 Tax=candidate division MSBL1 archaeon SCGC-AAA382C18 TaxID=1698281 RepID=A0A133VL86_9EURY|nr:nucleoside-diphosphate sugar epimerase [candidate division MSBL1 archaeon SCGC-AAA382C18]
MRVLVTGGAGFVGSHVAEYYAERGDEVVVLDNLARADLLNQEIKKPDYNWNYLRDSYSNVELVRGDVREYDDVREVAEDVHAIVHTAAQTAVTASLDDAPTDFRVNALGTFNILEAAKEEDAAVVYCSTNKVYGDNVNEVLIEEREGRYGFSEPSFEEGISEDFPIDLCEHTPYGCSKLAGDIYVQDYAERNEIDAAVFRMSCIYGTRQFGVEDQGWVAWFALATLLDKPLTIYGDGKQVRDVLYVSDLVRAFDSFIQKRDEIQSGVFNMGGGIDNTLSLLELLDILEDKTGKRPQIEYSDWRPSDQKVYISDISKAKKELEWEPKVDPEEGVGKLVKWIKENKDMVI